MKRFAFLLLLPLAACASLPASLPAPSTVANATVLDEQVAIGAEIAYKAQRALGEIAVDAGLLKGEAALRAALIDRQSYGALQTMRAAYRAGNADSYVDAASRVVQLTGQITTLVGAAK